jgi:hypothetical protein
MGIDKMNAADVSKLAHNLTNAIRENLLKNRIAQNKDDSKTLDNIDNKNLELKTTEANIAKNNINISTTPQSTAILSDPQEDALRKILIFNNPSRT